MPPKKRAKLHSSKSQRLDRERKCVQRASEPADSHDKRLELMRNRASTSRPSEPADIREKRLEDERIRASTSRASEPADKREDRLEAEKNRASTSRARTRISCNDKIAFDYHPANVYSIDSTIIGKMDRICCHCGALKWHGESMGLCCASGKVYLPIVPEPPVYFKELLEGNTDDSRHFLSNIHRYNSAFQMTSFGTDKNLTNFGYFTTYKIQGQCYHLIGSMQPEEQQTHKYVQVYFMNSSADETLQRISNISGELNPSIVTSLQTILHEHHRHVNIFKYCMELMNLYPDHKIVIHAEKRPKNQHSRRYNAPEAHEEVGVILLDEEHEKRDIVLQTKSGSLQRISETHSAYDALQYPLLFWNGANGYNSSTKQRNPTTGEATDRTVSCKDFYSFLLMVRVGFNHILRLKSITCQFMVDVYAKIETERLNYIRFNQAKLRAEEYIHLKDAIQNQQPSNDIGQPVILPSSFTGSPRYMHAKTQDAMAYGRKFGTPDLFITFTCNPKRPEISDALFQNQRPVDRHDIVARVFHLKQNALLNLLTVENIFGKLNAHMTTIEWQKRGLPHSHTLIWCCEKIRPNDVDKIISAELPNPIEDPELSSIIQTQLIHGPCGSLNPKAPCMKDGKCSKKYPRCFVTATQTDVNGYPLYRRRSPEEGGVTASIKVCGNNYTLDNRWAVPHSKLLCKIFNAHINVESCSSIKAIIYVTKYINKGCDMASFSLQPVNKEDEIKVYQTGRYISSNEAVWRIFCFDLHKRHPTVVNLAVHLENGQRAYFTPENAHTIAESPPKTTLTAFFLLCSRDEFASTLIYPDIPSYYTWQQKNKSWTRRKRGSIADSDNPDVRSTDAIGRVYTVHPKQRECFYLRLLLHIVRGPTSFSDIRTIDGKLCSSFHEACLQLGLLEDSSHWRHTMEEAAICSVPSRQRNLFAILLSSCELDNPLELWHEFKENMVMDFFLNDSRVNAAPQITDDMYNMALINIDDLLQSQGSSLQKCGMPCPSRQNTPSNASHLNLQTAMQYVAEHENKLNTDQQCAYDCIVGSVNTNSGNLFFVDAPGGTGKTFLINLLINKMASVGGTAVAVASSGIAATLLHGGRTAHSMFQLPFDLLRLEQPQSTIKPNSIKGNLLKHCGLLIWDEATMCHRRGFECLDFTMKDLKKNSHLFGGVTVVLAGDFRQTLPIIPRGTRADEIKACLKSSYLWPSVKLLHLCTNMRVLNNSETDASAFAEKLLQIGEGKVDELDQRIEVDIGKRVNDVNDLISQVYNDIVVNYLDSTWLSERCILYPKNDDMNIINSLLLGSIPTVSKTYLSIDTVCTENEAVTYPTEFLNQLEPNGMPPHTLTLKTGVPVMLLRNINPPRLCNGTRLIVVNLLNNIIEVKISNGHHKGELCYIPRIPLKTTADLPFQFKRLQFPIRVCFAMTINKSQGQSIKVVGLNLLTEPFSHGQLYVGLSRVESPSSLFLLLPPDGKTKNITYKEALQ